MYIINKTIFTPVFNVTLLAILCIFFLFKKIITRDQRKKTGMSHAEYITIMFTFFFLFWAGV